MKKFTQLTCSVVSCFVEYEGKVLLLRRAKQDSQFGLWGIPGGKLEAFESPRKGLQRELKEELSIDICPSKFEKIARTPLTNDCDGSYLLYVYYLKLDEMPKLALNFVEHSQLEWSTIENFTNYPLLFSQGKAFNLSRDALEEKIYQKEEAYA